jgi:hypothetical protein
MEQVATDSSTAPHTLCSCEPAISPKGMAQHQFAFVNPDPRQMSGHIAMPIDKFTGHKSGDDATSGFGFARSSERT